MATLLRTFKPSIIRQSASQISRAASGNSSQRPFLFTRPAAPASPIATRHQLSFRRNFSAPNKQEPEPINNEIKFDFKDLGISKPIKIFLIVVLSVLGTMETIFYIKLAMRKFFPPEEKEEVQTQPPK